MTIEWLSLSKLIPSGASAAKSIYDRVFGKSPRLNFDADSGGIELHILNERAETAASRSLPQIKSCSPKKRFRNCATKRDVVRTAFNAARVGLSRTPGGFSVRGTFYGKANKKIADRAINRVQREKRRHFHLND
jgi:hypothetical protein